MAIGDIIKRHPIATSVGAIVIFLLFYMMFSSGGGSSSGGAVMMPSGPSDAAVAANDQLAAVQAQSAAQQAQTQAQFKLGEENIAAQVTAARLSANTQKNQDDLAAKLATLQATLGFKATSAYNEQQYQLGKQANTLQAQVATAQINSQNLMAKLQSQDQIAALHTSLAIQQSNNATQQAIALGGINAQEQMSLNNNQTQLNLAQTFAGMNISLAGIQASSANYQAMLKPKSSGGLCFITTAVCGGLGKSDDCIELETLRFYRAYWLAKQPWGLPLLDHYRLVGPIIARHIENHPERRAYCETLYAEYIAPAVGYIQYGYNHTALTVYIGLVNKCLKDALACSADIQGAVSSSAANRV